MCIENGIQLGISRAHKHTETPSVEELHQQIEASIMTEIHEWFDFGDVNEG
jgi:hypothetical protein